MLNLSPQRLFHFSNSLHITKVVGWLYHGSSIWLTSLELVMPLLELLEASSMVLGTLAAFGCRILRDSKTISTVGWALGREFVLM